VSYATVSATPLSAKSEREKSVAVTVRSITIQRALVTVQIAPGWFERKEKTRNLRG